MQLDCNKAFGAGCAIATLGTAEHAGCAAGTSCAGTGDVCKGTISTTCVGGTELLRQDCAAWGLICRESSGLCTGPDEGCSCNAPKCEQTRLATNINGHFLRQDCARLGPGFNCDLGDFGGRCLQGVECEPDHSGGSEVCNGDVLTLCNAGKTTTVDCQQLGFSGCSGGGCY